MPLPHCCSWSPNSRTISSILYNNRCKANANPSKWTVGGTWVSCMVNDCTCGAWDPFRNVGLPVSGGSCESSLPTLFPLHPFSCVQQVPVSICIVTVGTVANWQTIFFSHPRKTHASRMENWKGRRKMEEKMGPSTCGRDTLTLSLCAATNTPINRSHRIRSGRTRLQFGWGDEKMCFGQRTKASRL